QGNRTAGERSRGSGRPRSRPDPTETRRWGGLTMTASRFAIILICLACTVAWCAQVKAQEPGKSNDEALDSLLEKLSEPGAKPKKAETSTGKPAKEANQKIRSAAAKKAGTSKPKPDSPAQAKTAAKQAGKPAKPSSPGSSDVSSKDKELDQLL